MFEIHKRQKALTNHLEAESAPASRYCGQPPKGIPPWRGSVEDSWVDRFRFYMIMVL